VATLYESLEFETDYSMRTNWALCLVISSLAVLEFEGCTRSQAPSDRAASILFIFRDGTWYSQRANDTRGGSPARVGIFGQKGDQPIVGDFDNSGRPHLGVFRQGAWLADLNDDAIYNPSTDKGFSFGLAGDVPVVGDWDGSGKVRIGVFRKGQWYLDLNGNFRFDGPPGDRVVSFGGPDDIPIVGDWDGSGKIRIGVFRKGQCYLDLNGNFMFDGADVDRVVNLGLPSDLPAVMTRYTRHSPPL
jgi:hypothetical protein